MTSGFILDHVPPPAINGICGYYLVRLRSHGPLMPARIWEFCLRDDDGTIMSDIVLNAEVAGRPWPVFDCYIRHRVWVNREHATAEQPGTSELQDCPGCPMCATSSAGLDAAMGLQMTTAVWPGAGYTLRRGIYPKCMKHPITANDYQALTNLMENKNWLDEYPINKKESTT